MYVQEGKDKEIQKLDAQIKDIKSQWEVEATSLKGVLADERKKSKQLVDEKKVLEEHKIAAEAKIKELEERLSKLELRAQQRIEQLELQRQQLVEDTHKQTDKVRAALEDLDRKWGDKYAELNERWKIQNENELENLSKPFHKEAEEMRAKLAGAQQEMHKAVEEMRGKLAAAQKEAKDLQSKCTKMVKENGDLIAENIELQNQLSRTKNRFSFLDSAAFTHSIPASSSGGSSSDKRKSPPLDEEKEKAPKKKKHTPVRFTSMSKVNLTETLKTQESVIGVGYADEESVKRGELFWLFKMFKVGPLKRFPNSLVERRRQRRLQGVRIQRQGTAVRGGEGSSRTAICGGIQQGQLQSTEDGRLREHVWHHCRSASIG